MASPRLVLTSVLVLLSLLAVIQLVEPRSVLVDHQSSLTTNAASVGLDCRGVCGVRCSRSSRPNLCMRACGSCCARCQCVPPGTYGNYEMCPCYAAITTRGGARKCP